jgi:hypothetical protein
MERADPRVSCGRSGLRHLDLRVFADLPDAEYVRTSDAGVERVRWHAEKGIALGELWLDHDLGPDDDIRPLERWLEEAFHAGTAPDIGRIVAHSANPVGAAEIVRAFDRWTDTVRVDVTRMRVGVIAPDGGAP